MSGFFLFRKACILRNKNFEHKRNNKNNKAEQYNNIVTTRNPDERFYACVVDKNRAGAKPTLLFRLNLAYNIWEELGYLRLKQEFMEI